MKLEETPVLLDGRARSHGIRETTRDEVVRNFLKGVDAFQCRVKPGLSYSQAGVNQWAGHWQLCPRKKEEPKMLQ